MGTASGLEDLVDLIYQAAIDDTLWADALERIVDLTGAEAGTLHCYDMFSGASTGVGARVDQGALDRAFADFAPVSPLTEKDPVKKRQRMRNYKPRIRRDIDWLPKDEFVKTAYYNDFFQTFGFHSDVSLGLMVEEVGGGVFEGAGVNMFRHKRRGEWTDDNMQVLGALHPHLIRSFRMGRRIAAKDDGAQSLIAALEDAPWGLFLLDAHGRASHFNQTARAFLAEEGGLTLVARRLAARRPADTRKLQHLVARAASPDANQRAGGVMTLATPNRHRPLSLVVCPLRGERASLYPGGSSVIVCVTDLDATLSLPEKELRELFGLTLTEARVALAVFEGLDPASVATHLGVALPTVRTHLARIFEKTETSGQAGLSRLLSRVAGRPFASAAAVERDEG